MSETGPHIQEIGALEDINDVDRSGRVSEPTSPTCCDKPREADRAKSTATITCYGMSDEQKAVDDGLESLSINGKMLSTPFTAVSPLKRKATLALSLQEPRDKAIKISIG